MSDGIYLTSYQPYEEGVRIKKALLRWRRKVLKALSDGHSLNTISYKSDIIPKEIGEAVRHNLKDTRSADDVRDAFEKVISHFLLGRVGAKPEDRSKPLPPLPVDIEITDEDIERARKDWDETFPEYAGLLDAEVIIEEEDIDSIDEQVSNNS